MPWRLHRQLSSLKQVKIPDEVYSAETIMLTSVSVAGDKERVSAKPLCHGCDFYMSLTGPY